MKKPLLISVAVVVAVAAYFGRWAWRAHKDLVTLEVNNVPLSEVVSKLRWQTWEDIRLHKDVTAWITLNVENASLENVFRALDEQIPGRCALIYALYRKPKSLDSFEKLLSGKLEPPVTGWTNWNSRPDFAFLRTLMENSAAPTNSTETGAAASPTDPANPGAPPAPGGPGGFGGPGGPGGFGGFGGSTTSGTAPVTVQIANQEIGPATFLLRRASRARIVTEDGTFGRVNLSLNQVPLDRAVASMAKQVNRKVAKYYAIEPRRMPQISEEDRQQFSQMPRPDREGMRQRFEEMSQTPEFQDRMIQRRMQALKNTTPEQRAQRGRFGGGRGGGGGGGGGRGGGESVYL